MRRIRSGCCARATSGRAATPPSPRSGFAPFHSITSSARPSSESGRVMPSAFAVLRLTTN